MRKEINLHMSTMSVVVTMAEGNPGAVTAMMRLLNEKSDKGGVAALLHLDDMNIRGSQIWVGYKDWADQDIEKFLNGIHDRDPEMIAKINEECGDEEKAVKCAASFKRTT